MVLYRRSLVAGGTFFFTVNLRDRCRTVLVDHAGQLREIVRGVRKQLPFEIDAMVILPDHWHAVWTLPPGDNAFARRMRLIKTRFTRYMLRAGEKIEKDHRGEYHLWQKRFWEHTIRVDADLESHVNYIHVNPVKHGHVNRVSDWPYSTFHRYVQRGLLPENWATRPPDGNFGK